jgi:RNA polymerase sigma-70 factor, ECF subfamily
MPRLSKLALRRQRANDDEMQLVAALRGGDEDAFAELIERHHMAMIRVAHIYVRNRAVAEEVVQETWAAVLEGIDRFEERSSLKTWLFRILTNRAKTRATREGRMVPFSALGDDHNRTRDAAVDPDRFLDAGHPRWPHHWAAPPHDWRVMPEERLLARETVAVIRAAIDMLPPAQRQVVTLRDVEGWSSGEVCDLLDLSEGNQRVLLHRARSKLRRALEEHFDPEVAAT